MEIKVTNDEKGKAQSFEASVELKTPNPYWGGYDAKFVGYGANEWSAKQNMIEQMNNLIEESV